ncbi:Beta-mannosyltransferase 1 [Exophiala dermatitidis]|uniref:Uncharacterized protein n=2 Tax=Exophiala dermatitidis TaxID=5970 RepID=H6BZ98_EXODN|nr:uncharacterized protein HMPREF1120_05020 [Exophiala dermatitidis NIH/UT8656]KAJ4514385.1 Beta-mannosyltransferase 1 [Exophiala dermatitidis]EHY56961.1 hypothetical protein HMPREF1120_05020 [Exophiala dermatitidis NIH/UT8656]KAJ4520013.1 Beta-mannosyltransferase 1 [Exophiala dermatitidis]KAJ4523850.1 Beta-mannosyltransferase 1 [Exophiala dermatitidis]KAJ4537212.1 Beta-mannosyltransferase 1 [Exophiala dermatitidis]
MKDHEPGPVPMWQRGYNRRRIVRVLIAAVVILVCLRTLSSVESIESWLPTRDRPATAEEYGELQTLPISGFLNDGKAGQRSCDELRYEGQLQVQTSLYLEDDLVEMATALQGHPMIDYLGMDKEGPFEDAVAKTWARLSGSSVWLEDYKVFLSVTRVIFYNKGVKHWPAISFLRGQLYDEEWNELKNYTISWRGTDMTFPLTFNIPAPYEEGGGFYGPEDPRIIIEDGVDDAEPIVVFNMFSDLKTAIRAMYIFRPFSNVTTILSINGQKERAMAEKNWAPFFHNERETIAVGQKKWPSQYIHFIHSFGPLTVLKCHIGNGWCDLVYEQKIAEGLAGKHGDDHGRMSGGTNLVPLALKSSPGVHAYVGFPRSHIDVGCKSVSMYRPELLVLTAYGDDFYLNFLSDSVDFGDAAIPPEGLADPCGEGHILIANSIAKWERSRRKDEMTISFSVADSTVQVLKLHGVHKFLAQLPHLSATLQRDFSQDGETIWDLRWSAVGKDVIACSVEAAQNYSIAVAAPFKGLAKGEKEEEEEKPKEESKSEGEGDKAKDDQSDKKDETVVENLWD